MVLDHSLGLPVLADPVIPAQLYDWEYMTERLEKEPLYWSPGTRGGYHALNFGWLVGELVRRVSGDSLGDFFRKNIATPLDLDLQIARTTERASLVG